jgi:dihydroxyacetone kinase-like protein
MGETIALGSLFQAVTRDLVSNRQVLNQADGYNQDHGDNMVRTFQTITKAVKLKQKQGSSDSAALAYAAKRLSKSGSGASAQLYAQGLTQAAAQLKGKQVDQRSGLQLLQTLIGGGGAASGGSQASQGGDLLGSLLGGMAGGAGQQGASSQGSDLLGNLLGGMAGGAGQQGASSQGGDLLGSLLGGMAGGTQQQSQQNSASQGGDLLGSLLGGLTGGSGSGSGLQDGLDLGDLLSVGMAFMQFKQQGKSTLEALVQAFMQMSGMGGSKDRTQSTQLVVSSFLQALGAG